MYIVEQRKKESKQAYVEVLEILKHMDAKYVQKIPNRLIEFLNKNASKDYKFVLDKDIPFKQQALKESTINILAMLNYNYWCEDEEHKKYLLNKYNENEIKYQQMLMEKYSRDQLFKRGNGNSINKSNYPQTYKDIKWYQKILEYFKKLFNK